VLKEELEVLVDKGFATALKSECTSDLSGKRRFTEPEPPREPNERGILACFPEQAKDCGGEGETKKNVRGGYKQDQ